MPAHEHVKSDVALWVGNLTQEKSRKRQMKIFPGLQHVVKQDFRTLGLTLFFHSQFLSSTHRLCEHGPPNVFSF
jgi:hypothetical protein